MVILNFIKNLFRGSKKYISINGTKIELNYKEASAALNTLIPLAPDKEARKQIQHLYVVCLKEYKKEQEEEEIVIDIAEEEEVSVSLGLQLAGNIFNLFHIVTVGVLISFLAYVSQPVALTLDQVQELKVPRTELIHTELPSKAYLDLATQPAKFYELHVFDSPPWDSLRQLIELKEIDCNNIDDICD